MEYHEAFRIERPDIERMLESGDETGTADALLSAAFYDQDWRWVQNTCLRLLDHPATVVRWNAAMCLGHIARIHKHLDAAIVIPTLQALKSDQSIGPSMQDALDDIKWYLRLN